MPKFSDWLARINDDIRGWLAVVVDAGLIINLVNSAKYPFFLLRASIVLAWLLLAELFIPAMGLFLVLLIELLKKGGSPIQRFFYKLFVLLGGVSSGMCLLIVVTGGLYPEVAKSWKGYNDGALTLFLPCSTRRLPSSVFCLSYSLLPNSKV